MIQRIQTLFIVIAFGLMVAFLFIPFAYAPTFSATGYELVPIKALDFFGLTLPAALAIACIVVSLLSFGNLRTQKIFMGLSALLTAACIGVVIYVITAGFFDTNPDVVVKSTWGGGGLFLVASVIAEIAACCFIASDQKKLRNSNRIR